MSDPVLTQHLTDLSERRTPNAVRQHRFRQRQQKGVHMVTIAVTRGETDKLCRLRCLDLDKLENRDAIGSALHLLLASIHDT